MLSDDSLKYFSMFGFMLDNTIMLTVCVTNIESLINKGNTLQIQYNLDIVIMSAVYDYFKFSVTKLTQGSRKSGSRHGYVVIVHLWIMMKKIFDWH